MSQNAPLKSKTIAKSGTCDGSEAGEAAPKFRALHAGAERSVAPALANATAGNFIMPRHGMRWRVITLNTKYSWHHGSPRGFRSRGHRIHSSGDYGNPPPAGEHAGLLRYRQAQTDGEPKIRIRRGLRERIGRALVECLIACGHRLLALSVSSDHADVVIELPDDVRQTKSIVGDAKRRASRVVKRELPGAVWSAGCDYEPIDDAGRLRTEVDYVLLRQGDGTWTWSFRDGATWCEQRVRGRKEMLRAG